MTIVELALEMVPGGARIGLGSGRAAQAFVKALGERLRKGSLRIQGVPTSEETARLAAGKPSLGRARLYSTVGSRGSDLALTGSRSFRLTLLSTGGPMNDRATATSAVPAHASLQSREDMMKVMER